MNTGFFDKNGTPIRIGDKVKLVLSSGEIRIFDVQFKIVERVVKNHKSFEDGYSKVAISGVVFSWNGFDLFPCVDEHGEYDTTKMEIIPKPKEEIEEKVEERYWDDHASDDGYY